MVLLLRLLSHATNQQPLAQWPGDLGAGAGCFDGATLLLASAALEETFPDQWFYFPSYEIVLDELRDYRYYSADMLHLNDQAIAYVWEKFDAALLSESASKIINELIPLLKLRDHRPMKKEGKTYDIWLKNKKEKISSLQKKHPDLRWSKLD